MVGGGAAGIAAGRRLRDAAIDCLMVEARPRLGGRAWTIATIRLCPLDLGCGWLHSADRNPWHGIAEAQGRAIDQTPPPWRRASTPIGFPLSEQAALFRRAGELFRAARGGLGARAGRRGRDVSRTDGRWNGLISAVGTYVSGAELERVSVRDFDRYDDSGVNWRVIDGYGTVIAAHGDGLPVVFGCTGRGTSIDSGRRLRVDIADGTITADAAIVTLPSALLANEKIAFTPPLLEKIAAAAGLPLGLADKLFLSLSDAAEFDKESRLFGRTDRSGTGVYHFRPFGRPQIEAYFGGPLAAELEAAGEAAFADFACDRAGRPARQRFRPPGEDRSSFIAGAAIRSPAAPIPMLLPGKAECRARWPRRWTIACSSPARRVRSTTIPLRTAPISPASPPPNR